MCTYVLSHIWLFVTLWTVAQKAPLSMEFSRQKHWSGLPFPSPGYLPHPWIEPSSLASPALASRFFTSWSHPKQVRGKERSRGRERGRGREDTQKCVDFFASGSYHSHWGSGETLTGLSSWAWDFWVEVKHWDHGYLYTRMCGAEVCVRLLFQHWLSLEKFCMNKLELFSHIALSPEIVHDQWSITAAGRNKFTYNFATGSIHSLAHGNARSSNQYSSPAPDLVDNYN